MKHLPALAVLAISGLTALAASWAGIPLAWVLGALVPTAVGSVLGVDVFAPRLGRKVGQLIVGTSIGLSLTMAALEMIVIWFPFMLLTAVVSILATALLCVPFSRAARVNLATGFFALTPGGLAEMARTGAKEGAQSEAVAFSQTIRVALLVCILPSLLLNFGIDGGLPQLSARSILPPGELAIVFAVAGLCVFLVRFTGANNTMRIAREEIFGPVLTAIPFKDEAEALAIANDTEYGLTGYLWTSDVTRAFRFTEALEAGMIWVNSENVRHLPTPFGGVKNSGIGRDGGDWSFDFYMETKNIAFATRPHAIQKLGG